jgi:UDP-N-acetylglucosamine 2-epimerase (non-hydrolysing)
VDRTAALDDAPITVVLGTRPEIVKLAEVVERLGSRGEVVHTGQHFDHDLSGSFYDELGIGRPAVDLGVHGGGRGDQLGRLVTALSARFAERRPQVVVVQGDTTSALAGALAANAADVPLVHVEAGLRSFDRRMPEEHNRVLVDHLADLCLAPTPQSQQHLLQEGIPRERTCITGNTVVEAVARVQPNLDRCLDVCDRHGVTPLAFVLATLHRPENVDHPAALEAILTQLAASPLPVVVPVHPRLARGAEQAGLTHVLQRLHVAPPLPYPEFLALFSMSAVAVSDSGGVQEEASVLKRPVVVVRRSTERPEVQGTFAHLLAPEDDVLGVVQQLVDDVGPTADRLATLPSPYGEGDASRRCVQAIDRLVTA